MKGKWVKAHQDDDTPYDDLSRDAKLNVDVDHLATWYRDNTKLFQSRQATPHFDETAVSISIGEVILTGNFDNSIRFHVNAYPARQHIIKVKQDWDDEVFDSVDWPNLGQHFKALPITARVQRTKLIHRWQPVGTQRLCDATVKDPILAMCPSCKREVETPDHLFLCDQHQGLRHRLFNPCKKLPIGNHTILLSLF